MKRPLSVTTAGWVVLIFTVWNAIRAWTSITWSGVLAEFSIRMTPETSALIGAFWTVAGLAACWGIWRSKKWGAVLLWIVAVGYTVWYWSERIIFQDPRPNVPFGVIVNLTLFVIIFFASRSLTREAYERDIESPKTE